MNNFVDLLNSVIHMGCVEEILAPDTVEVDNTVEHANKFFTPYCVELNA